MTITIDVLIHIYPSKIDILDDGYQSILLIILTVSILCESVQLS